MGAPGDADDALSPHIISYELEKLRLRSPPVRCEQAALEEPRDLTRDLSNRPYTIRDGFQIYICHGMIVVARTFRRLHDVSMYDMHFHGYIFVNTIVGLHHCT